MKHQNIAPIEQAGFTTLAWCQALSISRAKLYQLPGEFQPRSLVLGRRRIITESPREYLQRISKLKDGGA